MNKNAQSTSKTTKKCHWVRWLVIFVILFAAVYVFGCFHRSTASRWSHGIIFGTNVSTLSVDELIGKAPVPQVTPMQIEAYQRFAKSVYDEQYRSLDADTQSFVRELRAMSQLSANVQAKKIKLTKDNASEVFQEALKGITDDSPSFLDLLIPQAFAAEPDASSAINALTLHNLSAGLMLDGHYELSLVLGALAAAEDPHSASTAMLLGNLLRQSNNNDDALDMLLFALQQNPNDESILITLGMLYLDMGKTELARKSFNAALQLSNGGGPANQGMMLVSFLDGDLGGAYLYMLEGAKEGYTTVITEAYNRFIELAGGYQNYLKFAGPILDQYGFEHLTDFKRTRLAFDPTLDTVGQQLNLDRTFELPKDAPGVINSTGVSLNAAFDYFGFLISMMLGGEDLNELVSENGIDFDKLRDNDTLNSLLGDAGIDSYTVINGLEALQNNIDEDGNINVVGLFGEMAGFKKHKKVEKITYGDNNYEQEEFWLNILYDYSQYQYTKLAEEYFTKPSDQYLVKSIENADDKVLQKVDVTHQKLQSNPAGGMVSMFGSLFENGSFWTDKKFTDEQVKAMTKDFCPFNEIMAKGYQEAIILAEQYWLYTNNILGYIADDKIYNKQRNRRNALAAGIIGFFPLGASMSNGMMGLLSPIWGGMTFNGHLNDAEFKSSLNKYIDPSKIDAVYPKVPEFPITGMGGKPKPKLIVKVDVPSPAKLAKTAQEIYKAKQKEQGAIDPGVQDEDAGMCIVLRPGFDTMADVFLTEETPDGQTVMPEPDPDPHNGTVVTETYNPLPPASIGIKLGRFFELSQNESTGETTIGVSMIIAGANLGFNPQSGDLYLYGHAGADFAADAELGTLNVQGAGAKINLFLKGTVNIFKMSVESTDIGAEAEVHLSNNNIQTAVTYDPVFGVKRDTASKCINGHTTTITTETPI